MTVMVASLVSSSSNHCHWVELNMCVEEPWHSPGLCHNGVVVVGHSLVGKMVTKKDDRTMKGISWISVVSCVEHDHVKARLF